MTLAQQFEARGREEGREEGRQEVQREAAINLLREEYDHNLIARCTGLSVDDIEIFQQVMAAEN